MWLAAVGVVRIDDRSLQMSNEAGVGSYWAPAKSTCLIAEGEMVDKDCCTEAAELLVHEDVAGNYTEGIVPFSGSVGDGIA